MSLGSLWDNNRIHAFKTDVTFSGGEKILFIFSSFPADYSKNKVLSTVREVTGFAGRKGEEGGKKCTERICWVLRTRSAWKQRNMSEVLRRRRGSSVSSKRRRAGKRWEVTAAERKWRSYTCCTRLSLSSTHFSLSLLLLPAIIQFLWCTPDPLGNPVEKIERRTERCLRDGERRVDRVTEPFIRKDKVMQLFHSSNPSSHLLLLFFFVSSSLFCSISCS